MWMSDCIVVVDRNNVDANSLADITSAIRGLGAIVQVDEDEHVLEVTIPANELPTVAAMTGVSYVRCVFNYLCGDLSGKAA